jgi:hypothetical protein
MPNLHLWPWGILSLLLLACMIWLAEKNTYKKPPQARK